MNIRVLYFASAREMASSSGETVGVPEGSSLADVARKVEEKHPALARAGRSLKFSVNMDVADLGTLLRDGDEVGVLPPVAGG